MAAEPDVVVIGSGPNGLMAACTLARKGLRVLVLEAHPRRPGGAVASGELTLPGFIHDVGAGFFPLVRLSPAFQALEIEGFGVTWTNARFDSCHPARDGSYACVSRELDEAAGHFGSARDGEQWRRLARCYARLQEPLLSALWGPFPHVAPLASLNPGELWGVLRILLSRGNRFSRRHFETRAARRVLPSLALHAGVGPDDTWSAGVGYLLGMAATTVGFPLPLGGAQSITNALVTLLERYGGRLQLGQRATRVVVSNGRAVAVRTAAEEIPARCGVLADTSVQTLLLDLLEPGEVPDRAIRQARHILRLWDTFKVDWALDSPVPWLVEAARESAVVHTGEDLDDLARFVREVRAGHLPDPLWLALGQQSIVDPRRAPSGHHTLYAVTGVPGHLGGSWTKHREVFADQIEQRIEELAPGFRRSVLARRITTPDAFEAENANLRAGGRWGSSSRWRRQLVWAPSAYLRYRTPVRRLYLCSSHVHPGDGVHGMCGFNAAQAALRDFG